ncbi:MAG: hypothetical protein IKN26_04170 [Eubacterium sp.]|nr:hypothetical protein [Eubacterium sp.]
MLHTIISFGDVFYNENDFKSYENQRSSNPYDYIRTGWFSDNLALFEGVNNVNINCNFSSRIPGNNLYFPDK